MEQSYKKGTVADIISTLKKLVDRQEDDEVRAIYGSSPYRLSPQYAKFLMDSVNKSLKSLRKAGKKQMKNKEKERRLQKSSLKEFRKMRKEQE